MSISPTGGTRSDRTPPPPPSSSHRNPSHGSSHRRSGDFSRRSHAGGTTHLSAEETRRRSAAEVSGAVKTSSDDSFVSSERVTSTMISDAKPDMYHGNIENHFGGPSSRLHSEPNGKPSTSSGRHDNQLPSDPSGLHSNARHSSARRNYIGNANYLLNFSYDPISRPRPQPRNPPRRRQQRIRPYNKDLFLQANYKFVLLDTGEYQSELMDPDRMLQWEDVICVRYSTPSPLHCPICLDTPLCPQITTCGHIFCFPCILQYLLMGEEDHQGLCWKKCPLCFMLISCKDLYTLQINSVKHLRVGDSASFVLLNRAKDSLVPSLKNHEREDPKLESVQSLCHSFSKFIFTTDVDLSVREAKSDLSNWLSRAESGQVDDLEKMPYVCAALEQLEERRKSWTAHRSFSCSPPTSNKFSYSEFKAGNSQKKKETVAYQADRKQPDDEVSAEEIAGTASDHVLPGLTGEVVAESLVIEDVATSTYSSSPEKEVTLHDGDNEFHKDPQEARDSYTFYQAEDGQHLILHPLNMKCLLHHYGNNDALPPRISGVILEMETVTQSEAMRKRYRFLSHFSLTTTFQLCEIDMKDVLPPTALVPFMDEIKKRQKQRKRVARKEQQEKTKAEVTTLPMIPLLSSGSYSSHENTMFSLDDFEALGKALPSSSGSPAVTGRKLFSNVTRLGFAAAHDSPSLGADDSADSSSTVAVTSEVSHIPAPRTQTMMSFANVISSTKNEASPEEQRLTGPGKKGKKQTRVLLSTAGNRRY